MEFYIKQVFFTSEVYVISNDADFKNIIAYIERGDIQGYYSCDDTFHSSYIRLSYGNSEFDKDLHNIISMFKFVVNSFKDEFKRNQIFYIQEPRLDLKYASISEHFFLNLPVGNPDAVYTPDYDFSANSRSASVALYNKKANKRFSCHYDGKEYSFRESTLNPSIETKPTDNGVKEDLKQIVREYYQLNKEIQNIFDTSR